MKILCKRAEIAHYDLFLLFSTVFCYMLLDFNVKIGTKFSLRDKRLFEMSEVEIMRVVCICFGFFSVFWNIFYIYQIKCAIFFIFTPRHAKTCLRAYARTDKGLRSPQTESLDTIEC